MTMTPQTPQGQLWTRECGSVHARLDEHERRIEALEQSDTVTRLWERIDQVSVQIAELRGRIAGYLVAATLLGTVVAVIAQTVIAHLAGGRP